MDIPLVMVRCLLATENTSSNQLCSTTWKGLDIFTIHLTKASSNTFFLDSTALAVVTSTFIPAESCNYTSFLPLPLYRAFSSVIKDLQLMYFLCTSIPHHTAFKSHGIPALLFDSLRVVPPNTRSFSTFWAILRVAVLSCVVHFRRFHGNGDFSSCRILGKHFDSEFWCRDL